MMNYVRISEQVVEYVEQVPSIALMVSNAIAEHFDRRIWNEDSVFSTTSAGGIVVISYMDRDKEEEGVVTFYETYVQTHSEAVHGSTEYVDYEPWYKESLKVLLDDYDEELYEKFYPNDGENEEEPNITYSIVENTVTGDLRIVAVTEEEKRYSRITNVDECIIHVTHSLEEAEKYLLESDTEGEDVDSEEEHDIIYLVAEDGPAATLRIAEVKEGERYASVLTPHENILLETSSLEDAMEYYEKNLAEKKSNIAYLVIADIGAGTCRMQTADDTVRRQSVLHGGESIYLDTSSLEEAARCFHEFDARFNASNTDDDDYYEDEELLLDVCNDEEDDDI